MTQFFLLRSYDTWGEYEYPHGLFSTEEKARQAVLNLEVQGKENDALFGWDIYEFTLDEEIPKNADWI